MIKKIDIALAAAALAAGVAVGAAFMPVVNGDHGDARKNNEVLSFECGRSYEIAKMANHVDDYTRELKWCIPFVESARVFCEKSVKSWCDYPLSSRGM
jgi:hypothetical protein